jgi:hypothetical protein
VPAVAPRPRPIDRQLSAAGLAPGRRDSTGTQVPRSELGWRPHADDLWEDGMPRYFFDLVDDKSVYDKKGVTLPNEQAAREHAITFARELMESKPELLGEAWSKWSVQVCNGKFDRILKILL